MQRSGAGLNDRDLISLFKKVQVLSTKQKQTVKDVLDAFVITADLKKQLGYGYFCGREKLIGTAIFIGAFFPFNLPGVHPVKCFTEVDLADYAQLKEQTRKERIEENRNFNCLKHLYHLPEFQNHSTLENVLKKPFFGVNL